MNRQAPSRFAPPPLVLLALLLAACGSDPALPTAPTPTQTVLPPSGACGTLGLTAPGATGILNGSECPAINSAVVLLNMRDANGGALGACSGTVIAARAILTAAHCLAENPGIVRVWRGTGTEIAAQSWRSHPSYRGTGASSVDVAVVLMGEDLGRTPIPLLVHRDARVGESAVVAGWGRDQNSAPATLRAGLTTITAVSSTLLETQFGTNVSSVCQGDSGGPILLPEGGVWTVAGVTSATSDTVCNTGTNFYVAIRNSTIASFVLDAVPDAGRR